MVEWCEDCLHFNAQTPLALVGECEFYDNMVRRNEASCLDFVKGAEIAPLCSPQTHKDAS